MSKLDRPEYKVALATKVLEGKNPTVIAREMTQEGLPIARPTIYVGLAAVEEAGGLASFINKARAELAAENLGQVKQNFKDMLRRENDFDKNDQVKATIEISRGLGVFADFKYIHEEQHVFEHGIDPAIGKLIQGLFDANRNTDNDTGKTTKRPGATD